MEFEEVIVRVLQYVRLFGVSQLFQKAQVGRAGVMSLGADDVILPTLASQHVRFLINVVDAVQNVRLA